MSDSSKGTIRYIKIGKIVSVYGYLIVNSALKVVDILPYKAVNQARFPTVGYFSQDSNVGSQGHGRVETDNGKVSLWFKEAVTYAAVNFVYETTGDRTTNYSQT